jgi:hypothetical protein
VRWLLGLALSSLVGCGDGATTAGASLPGSSLPGSSLPESSLPAGSTTSRAPTGSAPARAAVLGSPSGSPRSDASPAALPSLAALKRQERAIASIEDALAVASAHSERARAEARALSTDLAADPESLRDGSTAAHALRLALDPDTAPIVLEAVAKVATSDAADLLDELARSGDGAARLTLLARDLRDVPALARVRSEALAAVVRLDDAVARAGGGSCEVVLDALRGVTRSGDSRARGATDLLLRMTGCGRKGTDDCWPCLRDAEGQRVFDEARAATQTRRFVGPWVTGRRAAPGATSRPR